MINSVTNTTKAENIKPPGSSGYNLSFYPHLVEYLNPVFNVSKQECSLLNSAYLAYFQALIIINGIIDKEKEPYELMVVTGKLRTQ